VFLATQASRDALEHPRPVELTGGDAYLEFRAKVDQVPAQPADLAGALGNQVRAMIGEQPDLHRTLVEECGRKALYALAQHRSRDSPRIELIGLPRLAFHTSRLAHHLRRDTHHSLANRQQRLLKPAGDMPAVLNRPDSLPAQVARPTQRRQMPGLVGPDLKLGAEHA
jgi:hypothetical protein